MRPRTLGQVFDDFTDTFIALDQDHVALADLALQLRKIIGIDEGVALERLGELADCKAHQRVTRAAKGLQQY